LVIFDQATPGPAVAEEGLKEDHAAAEEAFKEAIAAQAELDELRDAYSKLYQEAMDREGELEDEVKDLRDRLDAMVDTGVVDPTLHDALIKTFYLDTDNRDVENPTVNMLVEGVLELTKESLLELEKDQVLLKQYSKRIERLEYLINRDFG
jgi:regulator of PEP synthase PpsR (kinase-PPPase family)